MEKHWIDDEGRLRLEHDENHQMVVPFPVDEIWHLTDSWDIEVASRLIVLGYNENYKESISYGFEHCPEGSTGRDRAHALITIMDRVLTLAKAAIAIGVIKNPDTPENWIRWAEGKGYSVAHLIPADAPAAKVEAKRGITKQRVIDAFEGMHYSRDKWSKYLGDPPDWLRECRTALGSKKASATWNPVLIAAALHDRNISLKRLDAVFVGLKDWADEWSEESAIFRD